jgi:uncharacterized protein (TIGR00251 family)
LAKTPRKLSGGKRGAALAIRVTPRARRDEIVEVLEDQTVKIRLTAPPVEGKANEALVEFLAKVLGIPQSKIEIVAGQTGRDKLVSILDMDSDQAQALIVKQLKS